MNWMRRLRQRRKRVMAILIEQLVDLVETRRSRLNSKECIIVLKTAVRQSHRGLGP